MLCAIRTWWFAAVPTKEKKAVNKEITEFHSDITNGEFDACRTLVMSDDPGPDGNFVTPVRLANFLDLTGGSIHSTESSKLVVPGMSCCKLQNYVEC